MMETDGTGARRAASPLLVAALDYAARGWRVLPLHAPTPAGGCTCGAASCSTGKHPRTKNGLKDASTDAATIRGWWTRWPGANVGIVTGAQSGIVVLDIDVIHDGVASLSELQRRHARLPETLSTITGSGGSHMLYQHPGGNRIIGNTVHLDGLPGLDVRGDGGYIVAAPSMHASGARYEWENALPVAPLPDWLLALLAKAPKPAVERPAKVRTLAGDEEGETCAHWLDKALARAAEGNRNHTGFWLACQLRDAGVTQERAEAVLADYAQDVPGADYSLREALSSCRSAYRDAPRERAKSAESRANPKPAPRPLPLPKREPAKEPENIPPDIPPEPDELPEDPPSEPDEIPMPEDAPAKGDSKKPPVTKMLADAIAAAGEHFAVDVGGKLWAYRNGVYAPKGEQVVYRHVKRLLTGPFAMPERWTRRQQEEVAAFIAVDAPLLWEQPPLDRINCKNGLLDVTTRTLAPHSPDFLSPVQLPIYYEPDATCSAWESFIAAAFPGDAQMLAWEIVAWLMTPDTRIQKAALLLGEGGNGKSTYLTALKAFLGKHNTSSMPLQRLEMDRFAVAMLYGKMANICADLPSEALTGTSVFKAITGGDSLPAEYKFRDSFDFVPFSRLIFSANQPPRSGDTSEGFYDRWLAIPFVGRFRGSEGEIDRNEMDARLAAPRELSGVLNQALAILPGLRKRGRFTEAESTRKALEDFREITDPFAIWIESQTQDDPDAVTTCDDLRKAYNQYANKSGHSVMTAKAFTVAVRRARPNVEKLQRTVRGTLAWCYIGIRLTSEYA